MTKPALLKWVEIDLSAVEANVETVRGLLSEGVKLIAVVKADAYGHGAAEVGRLLASKGAHALGVLTVDEALALRRSGIKSPILTLSPLLPEQADDAVRAGLTLTADQPEQ